MGDGPFPELLDRADAVLEAQPLIDAACPLIREVVDHATWAFTRTLRAADSDRVGGENEDVAAYVLYRHLIELADAAEVLFAQASVEGSVPVLRAAFEASLSLDYILQSREAYRQRSLCWMVGNIEGRLRGYERVQKGAREGDALRAAYATEFSSRALELELPNVQGRIDRLRPVLRRPELADIADDFESRTKGRRRIPEWFTLMDGPKNRRRLAAAVGREAEYLNFYSLWSGFSHAADSTPYIRVGRAAGEVAFLGLRAPANMPNRAFMIVFYVLRATRKMIGHFRPGESLEAWYLREVKDRWNSLRRLEVVDRDENP